MAVEFRELKSLLLLAESGSITQTARTAHLTPAAIHKQLKQLERELGVPLYERKDGRLRPTAAAALAVPYIRDILGSYEAARLALEEWKGVRRGLLRIGAGPSQAIYLLPEFLRRYAVRCPQIDVDVQTGSSVQLLAALQSGAADLILLVAPGGSEDPSFTCVAEMQSEIVLACSIPGAPRRCALRRLGEYPFFLFRKGSRIENLIDGYLNTHRFAPQSRMRFDSAEALKANLLRQPGIAFLPLYTVEEEIRGGRLTWIRQREPRFMMRSQLLRRSQGYLPPAVNEFVAVVRSGIAARPS